MEAKLDPEVERQIRALAQQIIALIPDAHGAVRDTSRGWHPQSVAADLISEICGDMMDAAKMGGGVACPFCGG